MHPVLWTVLGVVSVIALVVSLYVYGPGPELSFPRQVLVTAVVLVFYVLAWINGSAYRAPIYLQQLVAMCLGSLIGVTLHRWRQVKAKTHN